MNTGFSGIIESTKDRNAPGDASTSRRLTPEGLAPMLDHSIPSTNEETTEEVPHGYCHCGCGQQTTIPQKSNAYYGYVRGRPLQYVHGHNRTGDRVVTFSPPNPSGLCMCGCGESTPIAIKTDSAALQLRGYPIRYVAGHNNRSSPLEYVVEDRGFETPCWIWQRSQDGHGYGVTGLKKAHTFMYERYVGPVPKGLQLDHLCRQRDCCNPDHLDPVTNQVNVQRGAMAKLTPAAVREIRLLASTHSKRDLSRRFNVDPKTIAAVLSGKTWSNVE